MEAINQATGEVKQVMRERNGVVWCPFCDRSTMLSFFNCAGCSAEFRESVSATEVNAEVEAEASDSTTDVAE